MADRVVHYRATVSPLVNVAMGVGECGQEGFVTQILSLVTCKKGCKHFAKADQKALSKLKAKKA